MQFQVSRSLFVKALRRASNIIARKSTMPILAHVLLKTTEQGLMITATDLGTSLTVNIPADVKIPGAVTTPGKNFFDVINNLPGETVSVRVDDSQRVIVKAEKAEFKMVGIGDAEYPKLPDVEGTAWIAVDGKLFGDMINKTLYSVSTDETRFHLNGIFFSTEKEQLKLVATDGHRLSLVSRLVPNAVGFTGVGAIVPRKGILELQKLLEGGPETIEVALRGSTLYARIPDVVLSVKLIDAQFPDYSQVLPKSSKYKVMLHREQLIAALKRISLLSSDKAYGVRFSFTKNLLQIAAEHQDIGEGREELDIEYSGDPLQIGFNAKYVLDSLNGTSAVEVSLALNDEISPGMIIPDEDPSYISVIMPMRL